MYGLQCFLSYWHDTVQSCDKLDKLDSSYWHDTVRTDTTQCVVCSSILFALCFFVVIWFIRGSSTLPSRSANVNIGVTCIAHEHPNPCCIHSHAGLQSYDPITTCESVYVRSTTTPNTWHAYTTYVLLRSTSKQGRLHVQYRDVCRLTAPRRWWNHRKALLSSHGTFFVVVSPRDLFCCL